MGRHDLFTSRRSSETEIKFTSAFSVDVPVGEVMSTRKSMSKEAGSQSCFCFHSSSLRNIHVRRKASFNNPREVSKDLQYKTRLCNPPFISLHSHNKSDQGACHRACAWGQCLYLRRTPHLRAVRSSSQMKSILNIQPLTQDIRTPSQITRLGNLRPEYVLAILAPSSSPYCFSIHLA